jgi:hypothetical protein
MKIHQTLSLKFEKFKAWADITLRSLSDSTNCRETGLLFRAIPPRQYHSYSSPIRPATDRLSPGLHPHFNSDENERATVTDNLQTVWRGSKIRGWIARSSRRLLAT